MPASATHRLGVLHQHLWCGGDRRSPAISSATATALTATAAAMQPTPTASQREQYDRLGYVVIDGLVSPDLVARLLDASNRLVELARSSSPPAWLPSGSRTALGPAAAEEQGEEVVDMRRPNPEGRRHTRGEPWHVAGTFHPQAKNGNVFLEFLGSERLLDTAQRFLGSTEMMFGDTGIFINTPEMDMSIGWHRDMAWFRPGDFSEATERSVWAMRTYDRGPGADTSGRMTDDDDRRINASNRTPVSCATCAMDDEQQLSSPAVSQSPMLRCECACACACCAHRYHFLIAALRSRRDAGASSGTCASHTLVHSAYAQPYTPADGHCVCVCSDGWLACLLDG
jgi:hypothetical protein